MTTLIIDNKELTKNEAGRLFRYAGPTAYPKTTHNKNIMRSVVDNFLLTLRPKS